VKKKTWLVVGILLLIASGPMWAHGEATHEEHSEMGHRSVNVPLGLESLKEIISVHPLFVHFPIGLLLMSTLFYWIGALTKNNGLLQAGRWTLYGGAVFSIISVVTGLQAAYTVPHDDEVHRIMLLHQNLGYAVLGFSVALSVWTFAVKSAIPTKGKWVFLVASLALAAILTQQADLGGRMVFLKGIGVGKKSMLEKAASAQVAHDHSTHQH
jgi:uncharacterized membrane protein